MAAKRSPKKTTRPKTSTPVLLYRLGDVPAARHAIPIFDLPPAYLDLAFYLLPDDHHEKVTLFDALPEPAVADEVDRHFLQVASAAGRRIRSP